MLPRTLLLIALALGALATTGCLDTSVDDQSVPWGRPADWEGGGPGFGSLISPPSPAQQT